MSAVIFCQTRHYYKSYHYFFELVKAAGYPVIYVDEIDPTSDNCYIVSMLNGEWLNGWQNPRARIIWWDLEWRLTDYMIPNGVDDVWASERWYATRTGAKYVVLGSDASLVTPEQHDKLYDVAFIQAQNGRRDAIWADFLHTGLSICPNDWDDLRDLRLKQSLFMCHTHQWDNIPAISPIRAATAAAYRMPLLCETCNDAGFLAPLMAQAPAFMLSDLLVGIRKNKPLVRNMADKLHQALCIDNSFKSFVEAAL